MSAERLRRAWWQSLRRMLMLLLLAALIGMAAQAFWPVFAATCALVVGWNLWRLHRLLARLERRRRMPPNAGSGLWNALESALYRRQAHGRARTRRLLRLLRGYRQAASAMHDGALIVQRASSRIVWFNKSARHLLGLHYPRSLDTNLLDALDSPIARDWLLAGRVDEPLMDMPCPTDPALRLS
ncbi:MAG: phosphate regulon sensor protein PhoR, partial [Arenimonas sp.]